ncbi:cyclin-J isoform X2 [Frankliniella occidentalis]|uniref:Cyclin-J isoform X2 n=1 Tax=Frankliniella occidentalis TaxID=133901 RepID=A0A6J1TGA0_FRAOC|nr:cyclin-J isoform X2 [Frankliniella occidentalis]
MEALFRSRSRKMLNVPREPWPIEYAAEHAELNRDREQDRIPFAYRSPQIQHRSYLVGWIRTRAEKFMFCTSTVHLAIYILDIFMDNFNIELDRLHLVALVCLQVASKYEERDVRIPKASQFNSVVNNRYQLAEFRDLEVMLLSFLGWKLNLPTAAHFAEYYSLFAVSKKDWCQTEFLSYETFWQEAQRAVKDYLDLALLDICMMQFLPSIVACACVLLARQQLRLIKWTEELQIITKYQCEDLTLCANVILRSSNRGIERKRKNADSPDLGYVTAGSTTSTPEGITSKRRIIVCTEDSNL